MADSIKSDDELRLEYNTTLALVKSWPIRFQKQLAQSINSPPPNEDGKNVSEIST